MSPDGITDQIEGVLEAMPHYHHYFPDHGRGHVERILETIQDTFLPKLAGIGHPLSEIEVGILEQAIALHDVGMANPKTNSNPKPGLPDSPEDLCRIREYHEIYSEEFVHENWQKLGLDSETYEIVARLCRAHRRKHYVSNNDLFPDEVEPLALRTGQYDVHVQLLAALIKLGDALDTDRRRTNPFTGLFIDMSESERKYWDACRCVSAVRFTDLSIVIHVRIPAGNGPDAIADVPNLARWKALDIFSELFLVLPFTLRAGLPWIMIELALRGAGVEQRAHGSGPVWADWWHSRRDENGVDASDIKYEELVNIAAELSKRVRPPMSADDTMYVLERIRSGGFRVPPVARQIPQPYRLFFPTSTEECKESFVKALGEAKEHIDLLCSDGLTLPPKVYDILAAKLRSPQCVSLTVFLLEAGVLYEVEGEAEQLTYPQACEKIEQARRRWSNWWCDVLLGLDHAQKEELRKHFRIVFVSSPELACLNGGAIIDHSILRLNIRLTGLSSSRGALLHCERRSNILPIIESHVEEMRRCGTPWLPDEEQA